MMPKRKRGRTSHADSDHGMGEVLETIGKDLWIGFSGILAFLLTGIILLTSFLVLPQFLTEEKKVKQRVREREEVKRWHEFGNLMRYQIAQGTDAEVQEVLEGLIQSKAEIEDDLIRKVMLNDLYFSSSALLPKKGDFDLGKEVAFGKLEEAILQAIPLQRVVTNKGEIALQEKAAELYEAIRQADRRREEQFLKKEKILEEARHAEGIRKERALEQIKKLKEVLRFKKVRGFQIASDFFDAPRKEKDLHLLVLAEAGFESSVQLEKETQEEFNKLVHQTYEEKKRAYEKVRLEDAREQVRRIREAIRSEEIENYRVSMDDFMMGNSREILIQDILKKAGMENTPLHGEAELALQREILPILYQDHQRLKALEKEVALEERQRIAEWISQIELADPSIRIDETFIQNPDRAKESIREALRYLLQIPSELTDSRLLLALDERTNQLYEVKREDYLAAEKASEKKIKDEIWAIESVFASDIENLLDHPYSLKAIISKILLVAEVDESILHPGSHEVVERRANRILDLLKKKVSESKEKQEEDQKESGEDEAVKQQASSGVGKGQHITQIKLEIRVRVPDLSEQIDCTVTILTFEDDVPTGEAGVFSIRIGQREPIEEDLWRVKYKIIQLVQQAMEEKALTGKLLQLNVITRGVGYRAPHVVIHNIRSYLNDLEPLLSDKGIAYRWSEYWTPDKVR